MLEGWGGTFSDIQHAGGGGAAQTTEPAKKKSKQTPPYIVWSPDGETPPKVSHATHQRACFAAHFMARKYPGKMFYVLGRMGKPALHQSPPADIKDT